MSEGRERGPLDFDDEAPAEHVPLKGPPEPPAPRVRAQPMRYLWVVGAAAVVLVVVLGLTTLRHGTERGARGVPVGSVMPPFAVPAAASKLDGDANIATRSGEGQAGHEPACTVRGADVVNGCALREAGPVVLAFFSANSEKCVAQLDAMQQVVRGSSRACASRRSRSGATATTCARWSGATAGASRSATTTTAR